MGTASCPGTVASRVQLSVFSTPRVDLAGTPSSQLSLPAAFLRALSFSLRFCRLSPACDRGQSAEEKLLSRAQITCGSLTSLQILTLTWRSGATVASTAAWNVPFSTSAWGLHTPHTWGLPHKPVGQGTSGSGILWLISSRVVEEFLCSKVLLAG